MSAVREHGLPKAVGVGSLNAAGARGAVKVREVKASKADERKGQKELPRAPLPVALEDILSTGI